MAGALKQDIVSDEIDKVKTRLKEKRDASRREIDNHCKSNQSSIVMVPLKGQGSYQTPNKASRVSNSLSGHRWPPVAPAGPGLLEQKLRCE